MQLKRICSESFISRLVFRSTKKTKRLLGSSRVASAASSVDQISPDKNISGGSRVFSVGFTSVTKVVLSAFGFFGYSDIKSLMDSLEQEFLSHPIKVTSLFLFSAAVTNTLILVAKGSPSEAGLVVRLFLIAISFIGLHVKTPLKELAERSAILREFSDLSRK